MKPDKITHVIGNKGAWARVETYKTNIHTDGKWTVHNDYIVRVYLAGDGPQFTAACTRFEDALILVGAA